MASKLGFTRTNNEELRIVMVGKTGIGKSATGNTILGRMCFESKFSAKSMTVDCSKGRTEVDGQDVVVIDTPGLFDTRFGTDKTTKDVCQCISYASPGPHVFLVVVRLGRYTPEEMRAVQKIQEIFGQAADKYSMVLFTGGDQLEDRTIEDFVNESSELKELVSRCNSQYHVFNNKLTDKVESRCQVTELLQKIRHILQKNGGSHYTNKMFQEAEKKLEEEKQRILKEKEDQIRKVNEEMEKKLQKKYDEQMEKMNKKFQAERERDRTEKEEENKRQRAEWTEERQKEREEREREVQKLREAREKEMTVIMNKMKEQHEEEVSEERKKLQSTFEKQARQEAEGFNILYPLAKVGEFIVGGFKAFGNLFK